MGAADRRNGYDVAISFASEDQRYAAALYRRLVSSSVEKVYLQQAAPVPSARPDAKLKSIYKRSSIVVVIAGQTYAGKPYPEMECVEATKRLEDNQFDAVQLVKPVNGGYPESLQSVLLRKGQVDHIDLPDPGWEQALEKVVRAIHQKLSRLTGTVFGAQAPTRYRKDGVPRNVPPTVHRHLKKLEPLFTAPEAVGNWKAYAHAGAQGCATLRGRLEQLHRANELIESIRDLSRIDRDGRGAKANVRLCAAVVSMLGKLRSRRESELALISRDDIRVPDNVELVQRLRQYFLRHLSSPYDPALEGFLDGISEILQSSAKQSGTDGRSLREQICNAADIVAETLHQHFWGDGELRIVPAAPTKLSPKALSFPSLESALQRSRTSTQP